MKSLIQRINWKKVSIIVCAIMLLLVLNRVFNKPAVKETTISDSQAKQVSIIEFGRWSSDEQREITGTILSGTDVDVRAEVPGIIEKTFVKIGDMVEEGQVLASFQRKNDATQISYENLLQQLAVAKIQASSSVQSAEIALNSAQRQLEQTAKSEAQNYSRTFDLLKTQARNAESEFVNILDWADTRLMVSHSARANADYNAQQIGKNNTIMRQNLKNDLEELLREQKRIHQENLPEVMTDDEVLFLATDRLQLLKKIRTFTRSFNLLVQGTPVTGSFSQANKTAYENEATSFVASIDAKVLSLETQIEAAKSEQGRNRLSVLGAENSVQNLEAGLAVARAQAGSQITQLETQIRLARSNQEDLIVRAPFTGTVVGKTVLPFDQVRAGDILFSLVGEKVAPKIIATITRNELMRIQTSPGKVEAVFKDGKTVPLTEVRISGKLNAITQKLEVEFPIEELPKETLVGEFVRIRVPLNGKHNNLLPISAVSFEPDGPEILILEKGEGKRQKIEAGEIISNAIEILSDLPEGLQVIRYRNRAHAGEKLEIRK